MMSLISKKKKVYPKSDIPFVPFKKKRDKR